MNAKIEAYQKDFNLFAKQHFAHRRAEAKDTPILLDAMEYSFFNGGKRFRPMLCFGVAEALNVPALKVMGFAFALECIHTYSLIHDDLPCMDNDDTRRGQPTNHIQFSEDIALLAGDALLTEAFLILARHYGAKVGVLVEMLSEGSGLNGMIRGQVLDLGRGDEVASLSDLINLHELKTGQLISMCFRGPALIADKKLTGVSELGMMLGLAFQVKDDLLDAEEDDQASFVRFLGVEGTQQYLASLTEKIQMGLNEFEMESGFLKELIDYNFAREK